MADSDIYGLITPSADERDDKDACKTEGIFVGIYKDICAAALAFVLARLTKYSLWLTRTIAFLRFLTLEEECY